MNKNKFDDRYDNIDFKLMLINTSSAKKNGRGASQ